MTPGEQLFLSNIEAIHKEKMFKVKYIYINIYMSQIYLYKNIYMLNIQANVMAHQDLHD